MFYFNGEFNVKIQQQDGANLAALIQSYRVNEENFWVHISNKVECFTFIDCTYKDIESNVINRNNGLLVISK